MLIKVFSIIQLILAILLIIIIGLQQKGSGLGAAFGGSSNIYSTKRGVDKILFQFTVVIAILFFGIALAGLILNQ